MILKVVSVCLFLLFGSWGGTDYLYRIERKYPPLGPTPEQCDHLRGCDIVVLGQGMAPESDLPLRYRNNGTFLQRLLEGVRVGRLISDSRILVSMAGEASLDEKKCFLDEYAQTVSFPRSRIVILNNAHDTTEEARFALAASHAKTLVVVTSASHIPRAMLIFSKAGAHAIAAPCDYVCWTPSRFRLSPCSLPLPSGSNFDKANRAAHECLGTLYERLMQ